MSTIKSANYPVLGMSCAACAGSVEAILGNTPGVEKARVNFAANTVQIEFHNTEAPALKRALQEVGYDLDIESADAHAASQEKANEHYQKLKRRTIYSAFFALPVFILGMFFSEWHYGPWISAVLSLPVLFVWGASFYQRAFKQALAIKANMDTLVTLSTGIAYFFSLFNTLYPEFFESRGMEAHVYYEAAVVIMTFISLGKTLEERAKSSTTLALSKLMGLQSNTVMRIAKEGVEEVTWKDLQLGDVVRVAAGSRIPVDGVIRAGNSYVDESMLSGESQAIAKRMGDKVYSGTLNQKGSLDVELRALREQSLLHQIIESVRAAQGSKASIQLLVDRIAGVFVPSILLLALVTFGIWYFSGVEEAFSKALYTSLAVLVIACPCALGLATPTAIMVGIGKGAENNILIKDAESLEIASSIDTLILDKTGTITQAKARVLEEFWLQKSNLHLNIIVGLEEHSNHPLATAMLHYAKFNGAKSLGMTEVEYVPGKGMLGQYEGLSYGIGNFQWLTENCPSQSYEQYEHAASGHSRVFFFSDSELLAYFDIGDSLKEGSREAIRDLQSQGLELVILSGDQESTVAPLAKELGISNYRFGVLPSDKGKEVERLQAEGKKVAMVGDGINDSEALAKADLSIAMGHGSDIAMDVAQITLMSSDLRSITKAFRLSGQIRKGIRENLFWAFIYNLIGIPIAAGILYPLNGFLLDPMIAGAAMAFSSVSVVLNSLRLRKTSLDH